MAFYPRKTSGPGDYKIVESIGGQECLCCKSGILAGHPVGIYKSKYATYFLCYSCIECWIANPGALYKIPRFGLTNKLQAGN